MLNKIIKKFTKLVDIENKEILKFIKDFSKKCKNEEKLLDAGAGEMPYKKYFPQTDYESCDFCKLDEYRYKVDFTCDLQNIPRENETYDTILCTQVLEHVPEPQKVINEFHRILKKQGKLFLTVPQGWKLHQEPYHFFNYTSYGIKYIAEKAGFKVIYIKEKGGYFKMMASRISYSSPFYLKHLKGLKAIFVLPFFAIHSLIFSIIIPFLVYHLDFLDKEKKYTLGYGIYCEKK